MTANNDQKEKTLIIFDRNNCNSVKLLAVKKNTNVKANTRIMNGIILTFSRATVASFMFDIIEAFSFLDDDRKDIFLLVSIINCLPYQLPTDPYSISILFAFVCKIDCLIAEDKRQWFNLRDFIKMRKSKMATFFDKFHAQDASLKNQVCLYWSCTKIKTIIKSIKAEEKGWPIWISSFIQKEYYC